MLLLRHPSPSSPCAKSQGPEREARAAPFSSLPKNSRPSFPLFLVLNFGLGGVNVFDGSCDFAQEDGGGMF